MEVKLYSFYFLCTFFYFPFPNAASQAPHARDMHLLRMSKSMLVACAQRTATIRATRAPGDPLPATGFTKGSLHGSSAT